MAASLSSSLFVSPLPLSTASPSPRRPAAHIRASISSHHDAVREFALKDFTSRRAFKVIAGLQNFDEERVASVVIAAEKVLDLAKQTRKLLPATVLSVTVPHTLSLDEQVKLAEMLEKEGVDIIQTEGGTSSKPLNSGVHGLMEKAAPTLAAAYSISRAVEIPVMCASGLSDVTAPLALAAGAAGVGVGSAVNRLNDQVAMIAAVRSIANALHLPSRHFVKPISQQWAL